MALLQYWREQRERIKKRLAPGIPKSRKAVGDLPKRLDTNFWRNEDEELMALFLPLLRDNADTAASALAMEIEIQHGLMLDWTLVNASAANWARKHAGKLVKNINSNTQKTLAARIAAWIETPGSTMGDLLEDIETLFAFSAARAKRVAVTEVTAAFSEGNLAAARPAEKEGLVTWRKTWQTNKDALVCPYCSALDGQTAIGIDSDEWTSVGLSVPAPPLHVNCRCWLTFEPIIEL